MASRGESTRPPAPARARRARERVLQALVDRKDAIAAEMFQAVRQELPWYGRITDPAFQEDLRSACLSSVDAYARWTRSGGALGAEELDVFRLNAQRRADQLIPLEGFIQAARVALRVMWNRILAEAGDGPDASRVVPELLESLVNLNNLAIESAAAGYLQEQNQLAADVDRSKRDLLEDLLAGRLPLREGTAALLAQLGFEPDDEFDVAVAVVADPGEHASDDALRAGAEALTRHIRASRHSPLVVVRHDEAVAIASREAGEDTLLQQVANARGALRAASGITLVAGIGTTSKGLGEVQRGYEEAHRALRLARTREAGVVSLDGMPLFDYLLSQADATAVRIAPAEVRELLAEDTRLGGILLRTLHAYIDADLNVGHAAAALTVHANTVHYRLRRVSEITGRNTRSFTDLVDLLCAVRVLRHATGDGA